MASYMGICGLTAIVVCVLFTSFRNSSLWAMLTSSSMTPLLLCGCAAIVFVIARKIERELLK